MSNCVAHGKGFTLLEVLLTVFILGLASALVSPVVVSGIDGVRLKTTTKRLATTFINARVLAVSEGSPVYARISENKVVIESSNTKKAKKELSIPDEVKVNPRSEKFVVFYPKGNSTGGVFEILDKDKKPIFEVRVEASTGRVKVVRI